MIRRSLGPAPGLLAVQVQTALLVVLAIATLVGRWFGSGERRVTDRELVVSWLTCHDCGRPLLDSVVGRAGAHDSVVGMLRRDLLQGPGPRLASLERTLRRMRRADSAYLARRGMSLPIADADSFVAWSRARYEKAWRRQAAVALAAIYRRLGSQAALAALRSVPDSAHYLASDPVLSDTVQHYRASPP